QEKRKLGVRFMLRPEQVSIDDSAHMSYDFAALATTATGQVAGQLSRNLSGDLQPEMALALKKKGLTWDGVIELPAGDYNVRFLVRDGTSGRIGSVSVPLSVK